MNNNNILGIIINSHIWLFYKFYRFKIHKNCNLIFYNGELSRIDLFYIVYLIPKFDL